MRIDRIEASRHKRGRLLVFMEDGACLKITEQEALDFGLRAGDDLDETAVKRLKAAAGISDVKATAADLVGKRAMSRAGLEKKLREKGASEQEIRYAAEWMEAIGAIDDADYAAVLAHHYGQLGYGPAYVRQKLYEKGVPRDLWDGAVAVLPEADEQIDAFLRNRLRGQAPDEKERKRLTDALLRRGFSWSDVKAGMRRLGAEIGENDTWN